MRRIEGGLGGCPCSGYETFPRRRRVGRADCLAGHMHGGVCDRDGPRRAATSPGWKGIHGRAGVSGCRRAGGRRRPRADRACLRRDRHKISRMGGATSTSPRSRRQRQPREPSDKGSTSSAPARSSSRAMSQPRSRSLTAPGVAACTKRFPGHGLTEQDWHLELPVVVGDVAARGCRRSGPDRGGSAVDHDGAHRVPVLEPRTGVVRPAIVQGVLREQLGFGGVVFTDALEMKGLSDSVGIERGAVLALEAGVDELLIGHNLREDAKRRLGRPWSRLFPKRGCVRQQVTWSASARGRHLRRSAGPSTVGPGRRATAWRSRSTATCRSRVRPSWSSFGRRRTSPPARPLIRSVP